MDNIGMVFTAFNQENGCGSVLAIDPGESRPVSRLPPHPIRGTMRLPWQCRLKHNCKTSSWLVDIARHRLRKQMEPERLSGSVVAVGSLDPYSEDKMPPRTTFLGRLIGLYLIFISLAMLTHKQATIESMTALMHNPPLLFVVSLIAVAAGLAMVLSHNVWSGGMLPVVVTVTGWLMLTKACFCCFCRRRPHPGFFSPGPITNSSSLCTPDCAVSRHLLDL